MKKLMLILFSFCIFLTACSKNPPEETETDNPNRSTVFSEQIISVPEEWSITVIPTMTYADGILQVDGGRYTEYDENGDGYPEWEETILSFSADGTFLSAAGYEEEPTETASAEFAPLHDGARVIRTYPTDGGTLVYETLYTDYEAGCWVHLYDKKANLVFTVTPADPFGYELSRDINNMVGDVFTVMNVVTVPAAPGAGEDAPARYGILTTEGFVVYDSTGTLSFKIDNGNTPTAIIETAAGLLYLSENRQGQQKLCVVDTDAGKLGAEITLPEELASTAGTVSTKLLAGDGYDLYAYNGRGLFGLRFTDAALNMTHTLVIDWSLSDIAPSDLRAVCMIDAETAAVVMREISVKAESTLALLHMVPKDEIVQKKEIVLAKLDDDYYLQYAIRDFNKASDTHRVVIRDYTQYDREKMKLVFDADIAAGNIPDLVLLGTYSSMFDTLASTYERSGLFADLTPLLQADADFNYDGLLGYITKPYMLNGAQYLFPITPTQHMFFGHAEDFGEGGGMTADEFLTVVESWSEDTVLAQNSNAWRFVSGAAVHECYDETTAVCTFNDGTLSALYARANAIPYNRDLLDQSIGEKELFRTGAIRLYESHGGYNNLFDYVKAMYELGDAVPVGVPNADGVLCMGDAILSNYLAITETSDEKAACVELLQMLIDEKRGRTFDMLLNSAGSTFYREDIEQQLAFYDGITVVINGRSLSPVSDEEAVGQPGIHIKLTEEDAAAYTAYLDSISLRVNNNTQAASIFWEEYYADLEKPFEERLEIIQSKVSIYLSEQLD